MECNWILEKTDYFIMKQYLRAYRDVKSSQYLPGAVFFAVPPPNTLQRSWASCTPFVFPSRGPDGWSEMPVGTGGKSADEWKGAAVPVDKPCGVSMELATKGCVVEVLVTKPGGIDSAIEGKPGWASVLGGKPCGGARDGGKPCSTMAPGGKPGGAMELGGKFGDIREPGGRPGGGIEVGGKPEDTRAPGGNPSGGGIETGGKPCTTAPGVKPGADTIEGNGNACGGIVAPPDMACKNAIGPGGRPSCVLVESRGTGSCSTAEGSRPPTGARPVAGKAGVDDVAVADKPMAVTISVLFFLDFVLSNVCFPAQYLSGILRTIFLPEKDHIIHFLTSTVGDKVSVSSQIKTTKCKFIFE